MAAGAPPEAVERLLGAVELTAGGAFPAAAVGRPQPTSGRGLLATRLLPHATPQLRPGFPCPPPQVPHNIGQVLAAMGPDAVGEEVWTYWGAPYREQPCWAAVSLSCSGLCLARWPSSSDLWDFCSLRTVARFLLKAPDTMPPSRPLTRPPTATRCGRMGWWSRRAWLGRPAHRCAWRRPAAAAWQPPSWRTGGGWRRHRPHHCQLWRRQHRRLQQGQCRTRRASAMTCDSPCPQASAPRLRIPQRRPPVQTTALRPLDAATASTGSWQSIWWQRVLVAWAAALVRGAHCATRQSTAGPLAMCGAQGAAAWQKRWRRGTRPRCPCSGQPGSWSRRCWPTACQRTSARCRRLVLASRAARSAIPKAAVQDACVEECMEAERQQGRDWAQQSYHGSLASRCCLATSHTASSVLRCLYGASCAQRASGAPRWRCSSSAVAVRCLTMLVSRWPAALQACKGQGGKG